MHDHIRVPCHAVVQTSSHSAPNVTRSADPVRRVGATGMVPGRCIYALSQPLV
ncbi:hypothetical protein [Lysobacter gummosus]|uniref:hypothetical protein n=1 Tax=Lysobacter gummosus TaxID=262324 RepID=UPI00363F82AF